MRKEIKMKLSKENLIEEIKKRSPWYQRIEFPDYGITTTDDIKNVHIDPAPDNRIDGLDAEQASQLRPTPKWKYIKNFLPVLTNLEILEIGCNNGFFSFKFAELGAKKVIGIDANKKWLTQAKWVNSILGYEQVSFFNCDFFLFDNPGDNDSQKILKTKHLDIPLPQNQYDLIFSSTVTNHMFFPFLAIYKMLTMSRKWVVIDDIAPTYTEKVDMTLYTHPSGRHHYFNVSEGLLVKIINQMGIPSGDIKTYRYNDNKSLTTIIKTVNMSDSVFKT